MHSPSGLTNTPMGGIDRRQTELLVNQGDQDFADVHSLLAAKVYTSEGFAPYRSEPIDHNPGGHPDRSRTFAGRYIRWQETAALSSYIEGTLQRQGITDTNRDDLLTWTHAFPPLMHDFDREDRDTLAAWAPVSSLAAIGHELFEPLPEEGGLAFNLRRMARWMSTHARLSRAG